MKEFKKFVSTDQSKVKKSPISENNEINPDELPDINEFDPKDVNMVKNLADKYKGNESQLMSDIISLANKNKKEGKLKNSDLDSFSQKISPMLNSSQKKMLTDIVKTLRD